MKRPIHFWLIQHVSILAYLICNTSEDSENELIVLAHERESKGIFANWWMSVTVTGLQCMHEIPFYNIFQVIYCPLRA